MNGSWTWEATATIIQAVATVIALGGVALTFYLSMRAERRERERRYAEAERADASADRAERAASLGIDTMERIAEAIEDLAQRGFGGPTAIAPTKQRRVTWSLEHLDGDRYSLMNTGNADAYSVVVSADPTLPLAGDLRVKRLAPGSDATFQAARGPATRDSTITVEWADAATAEATTATWRYPLPPRQ